MDGLIFKKYKLRTYTPQKTFSANVGYILDIRKGPGYAFLLTMLLVILQGQMVLYSNQHTTRETRLCV